MFWFTVLSGGGVIPATGGSLNPVTDGSRASLGPASCHPRNAPVAISSLSANNAVGRRAPCKKFPARLRP